MSVNLTVAVNWSDEEDLHPTANSVVQPLQVFQTNPTQMQAYQPNTSPMPTGVPTPVYPPVYSPYLPTTIPYYLPTYLPIPFTPSTGDLPAHANLVTTPAQQPDKAWYPDFGATNHFTHGQPTCNHAQLYMGSSKVQVSNSVK